MLELPDPAWYVDHVLAEAEPGGARATPNPLADWRGWWRVQERAALREYPQLAGLARGFVVTTAQLADAGIARHTIRQQVRLGRWSVPRPGTIAIVDPAAHPGSGSLSEWAVARRRHALRCTAAAIRNQGFVVSGTGAAVLLGLPTMTVPEAPMLTAAAGHHHFRVARMSGSETADWYGITLTDPARTLVDLARHDRRSAIMATDAALRDSLVTPAQLSTALERAHRTFGVVQARQVLGLASPLGESPLESITRLALHDDGFPSPELQVEIAVPGRYRPYRVDMLWPAARLILELDGRTKYTAHELWRERGRDRDLIRLGYRIERFTWREIVDDWPACATRLRQLLAG